VSGLAEMGAEVILFSPPVRLSALELHPYKSARHLYLYASIHLQHLIAPAMIHLMPDSVVASVLVSYSLNQQCLGL
jgi:hypothetical protein